MDAAVDTHPGLTWSTTLQSVRAPATRSISFSGPSNENGNRHELRFRCLFPIATNLAVCQSDRHEHPADIDAHQDHPNGPRAADCEVIARWRQTW
jgi:hypothetical protein